MEEAEGKPADEKKAEGKDVDRLYSPTRQATVPANPPDMDHIRYDVGGTVLPARTRFNDDLSGTRSLKIDVLQTPAAADDVLTFRSLGVDPELVVTLADHQRLSALGWGLALIVGLLGVVITRRPTGKKVAFILTVAVVATVVPLIVGGIEIACLCNMLFYAACWLIPYYVAAGAVRALWRLHLRAFPVHVADVAGSAAKPIAVLLMAVAIGTIGNLAKPQAALAEPPEASGGPYVVQVVEPSAPVNVPEDAHDPAL